MKKSVFAGALLASLLLAAVNNLVSHRAVAWIGSPDVLEKPSGWPSLTFAQGVKAGVKVAIKGFHDHQAIILGALAVIIAIMIFLKMSRGANAGPMIRTVLRVGLAAMFL